MNEFINQFGVIMAAIIICGFVMWRDRKSAKAAENRIKELLIAKATNSEEAVASLAYLAQAEASAKPAPPSEPDETRPPATIVTSDGRTLKLLDPGNFS